MEADRFLDPQAGRVSLTYPERREALIASVGIETQLPPAIFTLAFLITYITAPSPAYIGFFV